VPLTRTLGVVTCAPVAAIGDALGSLAASAGRLVEGGVADVCVFDAGAHWRVSPAALRSQGKHTPFAGHELPGRVKCTLVAGTVAFDSPE
jgi:dihydroorotase